MQEKAAEAFFLCLQEIARNRPCIALLENVVGLLKVWEQVQKALQRLNQFGYTSAKVSSRNINLLIFHVCLGPVNNTCYPGWQALFSGYCGSFSIG